MVDVRVAEAGACGGGPRGAWFDHAAMAGAHDADPDGFWLGAATAIEWDTLPDAAKCLRPDGTAEWFPGGRLNTCHNALDRHVRDGKGGQAALLWDSPASGESLSLSYAALLDRVARFAGGLRRLGVGPGERVLISMPPVPEAVIAMLACARLGAVHVFVFGGHAPAELASRIDDTRPVVLVTASCGFQGRVAVPHAPLVAQALALCLHRPRARVVLWRPACPATPDEAALDWRRVEDAPPVACVPMPSAAPLYVLHTSGTTGQPKGVVRDTGGHAVALLLSMGLVYGVGAGEVFWTSADPGWVVGHSYGVYGPLLAGCTTVLFEGTPEGGAYWRACDRHGVSVLLTAPTALRLMRREDAEGRQVRGVGLERLRAIFVAGERADRPTLDWAEAVAGVPVLDHWWQTETGWSIAGAFAGLGDGGSSPAGRLGRPGPGFDVAVLREDGTEAGPGELGELALRLPLPPGCLSGLWADEERTRFGEAYLAAYPGFFRTFDLGERDGFATLRLLSRADDAIKVSGRRIAGGLLEEALSEHPDVAECAVARMPHALRGEVPVAFVILRAGAEGRDRATLRRELLALARGRVGAMAALRRIEVVESLPRTRSGKIMRRMLAASAADVAG